MELKDTNHLDTPYILTVITKRALRAPEKTIDLGWCIAISVAMMNVSSPIWKENKLQIT